MWYSKYAKREFHIQTGVHLAHKPMDTNQHSPLPQPPVESSTTYQQLAYDHIKARIMNLEYKPGQNITDREIAEELNISRTPVREALRLLEHEGLIVSQPRRGWRVYSLSLEDIQEIFDIKVVLESAMARWAAGCNDEAKRAALRSALERMKQATANNDHKAWVQADMELHGVIFSMCSNERATRIIQNLNDQWWRVRIGLVAMEGRMQRSIREHEAFVSSILAGDGEAAERQMRTHLEKLRHELVHVLTNLVLPFARHGI